MADTENDLLSPSTDLPVSITDSPLPDESGDPKTVVVHIPRVAARTITGPANLQNQGAIDWGHHGLLAYGSNYAVVVIDTKNIQPIQCLDRHKSMVNKVVWQRGAPAIGAPGLASSDTSGHIVVWDVAAAEPLAVLQDGTKPILDMSWVSGYDGGERILAALHPPHTLVVWDTRTGAKLWKKMYAETLVTFDFDPFNPANVAFLCADCILFAEDFSLGKPPASLGRKFYVSSPRPSTAAAAAAAAGSEDRQRTADRLRRLMRDLTVAEAKPKAEDSVTAGECVQLRYHRSTRHHLLALFARELVVLDLHIGQAVAVVPLEKTASPFVQVFSASQRDVLFCLHESGSVSAKLRRRANPGAASPLDAAPGSISSLDAAMSGDALMEMGYEQRCASEVVRLAKGCRVLGMAVSPTTERHIALLASTGRLVFVELAAANVAPPPLWTETLAPPPAVDWQRPRGDALDDLFGPLTWEGGPAAPPLRLPVTGALSAAAAPLTALRMCPPLTTRNWLRYRPLMAAGTAAGVVQVYDMAAGTVHKELAVHSAVVRGIEWTGLHCFLSHAHAAVTGGQLLVRNELMLTNTLTGHSVPLRLNKGDEPPIEMLRVSTLKQYFIVIQKDGPFELWDLRKLCMLRTMPKKFPNVVALEWSPIHNLKSLKRRTAAPAGSETESGAGDAGAGDVGDRALATREHFVFSDSDSQLYHFSVEGNTFRDGIKIPPEAGVGVVTCIAFKNDQIVQADADGTLNMWDLRARTSKNVNTGRGMIKKMRFAPGKGNLKLLILYNDGVDVVDLKRHFDRIAQLRTPKDMVKVLDIDWAASDKPVLATQDGCLRIMDMALTCSSSPISDYEFQDPVFCPALLPPPAADLLQLLLSWQPARQRYDLNFTEDDGFTAVQLQAVHQQLEQLDAAQRASLLDAPLGTGRRALAAARISGDAAAAAFWTVALHYLEAGRRAGQPPSGAPFTDTRPAQAPLDTGADSLADSATFARRQLERAAVHEAKRRDHAQTRRVVEQLVLLGETDRAVQLLLETDIAHPAYYTDAIKACLVATIQATGAAQSTIKLVATNLIANGSVPEGVQLLCLIGKGLDASRYLLSYAMWEPAVWLAKVALQPADANEVARKWAEHLWANGQREKAVLVALTTGQPDRVIEMLRAQRFHARAALYRAACQEFGVQIADEPAGGQHEFVRLLFALGARDAALAAARRLGEAATAAETP